MKKKLSILLVLIVGTLFLTTSAHALSYPVNVQFDPLATGSYSINDIREFDWVSEGNAAIVQDITVYRGWDENTQSYDEVFNTTLNQYFGGAYGDTKQENDFIEMNVHAQTRLANFVIDVPGPGNTVTPVDYEVTMVLSMTEWATYGGKFVQSQFGSTWSDTLDFEYITEGSYAWYLDDDPDSDNASGAGFINDAAESPLADPFLWGTTSLVSGSYTTKYDLPSTDPSSSSGVTYLTNTIDGYNTNVIDVDPASPTSFLKGTSFDTTIILGDFSTDPTLQEGGVIGVDQFKYEQGNALILGADANSEFTGIPEPTTMVLFGIGLLGLAGITRRNVN